MHIEQRTQKKIEAILQALHIPLTLYDTYGEPLFANSAPLENPQEIGSLFEGTYTVGQSYCRRIDVSPPLYLCAPIHIAGATDVLLMADMLLVQLLKNSPAATSRNDIYLRILKQDLSGPELLSRATEYQLTLTMSRAVLLFHFDTKLKQNAYQLLKDLIPLTSSDVLVDMNLNTVALIKDMQDYDDDILIQYVKAVQETLLEETAKTILVSIGTPKPTLDLLGESYMEAQYALDVGYSFHPTKGIYDFNRLLLERFLINIPTAQASPYYSLLFNNSTDKLFTQEMMDTINMFFQKNLNLSDTARQLFIHRNTLVYRLDKISRQTGLDLRHFDDAITFKVLYELKKRENKNCRPFTNSIRNIEV